MPFREHDIDTARGSGNTVLSSWGSPTKGNSRKRSRKDDRIQSEQAGNTAQIQPRGYTSLFVGAQLAAGRLCTLTTANFFK